MKTKQQVADEIVKLKALKPVPGPHEAKVARMLELSIEELEHGFDQTAGEWDELTDEERDTIQHAADWRDGYAAGEPSKEFVPLVQ